MVDVPHALVGRIGLAVRRRDEAQERQARIDLAVYVLTRTIAEQLARVSLPEAERRRLALMIVESVPAA